MRKLSTWAKYHPYKARIVIITVHFLLGGIAWLIGSLLFDLGNTLPTMFLAICIMIFITTAFLYPLYRRHKPNISKQIFYIQRKACDLIIAACSFCMVCWVATNFHDNLPRLVQTSSATTVVPVTVKPTAEEILKSLEHRDKKGLTRTEKRILKKEFRHQLKEYAKAKITGNKAAADKAWAIVLAIIVAIGLLWLLGALACSLSCNGSEAAAIVVGIVGTVAIIWLLVVAIKSISRGGKKKTPEKTETGLP